MVAEAFADERVVAVIAHTLAERNASNRVLEKLGYRYDGDAGEDGEEVWRYWLTVQEATGDPCGREGPQSSMRRALRRSIMSPRTVLGIGTL